MSLINHVAIIMDGNGRRVQQKKAQLDHVEDKVEEHVHRRNDARHAFRDECKV